MLRFRIARGSPWPPAAVAAAILASCGGSHTATHTSTATASPTTGTQTAHSAPPATGHPLSIHATLASWRLPVARYRTMAVANGRSIFVLGGLDAAGATVDTVYRVDAATGTTKLVGTLTAPTHGGAALMLGQRAFLFGGAGPPVYDLVQQYIPATGHTTVAGHLPAPRADLAAAAVGNQVVIAAGFDGIGPLDTVLATADERHFRLLVRLPQAVRYPAVAVVGNSAYLFGGLLNGGEYTGTFSRAIQRVDLTSGRATIAGRLATPYAHAMATVRDSQVFLLGGSTPAGATNAILRFDPATGGISHAGTLPEHVADGGIATIADTTYIVGGIATRPLTTVCIVKIQ